MSAMLKGTLERVDIGGAASVVLVVVAALFLAIAYWAIRADSAGLFERVGRLPLENEGKLEENDHE